MLQNAAQQVDENTNDKHYLVLNSTFLLFEGMKNIFITFQFYCDQAAQGADDVLHQVNVLWLLKGVALHPALSSINVFNICIQDGLGYVRFDCPSGNSTLWAEV